jgi:hypothetical protein
MTTLAQQIEGVRTVSGSSERDAIFPSPATGQKVYNTTTRSFEQYTGSAWVPVVGGQVFDVKSYGAIGDGVTNDAPAFQLAINAARVAGGVVFIPAGEYRLTSALDLTSAGVAASLSVTIRGAGRRSTLLSVVHTGHGFDCTGTAFLSFEDFSVSGNAVTVPKTAFFLARNSTGGSAGWHQFTRITTTGQFSVAVVYNYAAEDMRDSHSTFSNDCAAGKCIYITGSNKAAQQSSFSPTVTVYTTVASCTDHRLFGTEMWNGGSGNSDCLYLESVRCVTWRDGFSTVTNNGRSHVYVDASTQPSSDVSIDQIFWDGATAQFGIAFSGAQALTRIGCTNISNGGVRALDAGTIALSTVGFAIYMPDSTAITQLLWKRVGGSNKLRLYEVYDSEIECSAGETLYAKYAFQNNRVRVSSALYTLDRTDFATGNRVHFTDTGASSEFRSASFTWDPGSISSSNSANSGSRTVTGAAFGMSVDVMAPYDLQGLQCTAYVDAANSVKVLLYNLTGGAIDLASGTWKVRCRL